MKLIKFVYFTPNRFIMPALNGKELQESWMGGQKWNPWVELIVNMTSEDITNALTGFPTSAHRQAYLDSLPTKE